MPLDTSLDLLDSILSRSKLLAQLKCSPNFQFSSSKPSFLSLLHGSCHEPAYLLPTNLWAQYIDRRIIAHYSPVTKKPRHPSLLQLSTRAPPGLSMGSIIACDSLPSRDVLEICATTVLVKKTEWQQPVFPVRSYPALLPWKKTPLRASAGKSLVDGGSQAGSHHDPGMSLLFAHPGQLPATIGIEQHPLINRQESPSQGASPPLFPTHTHTENSSREG